jgi:hypothetical protein
MSTHSGRPPDTGVDSPVPLPNVTSKILSKVIEYAKFHVDKPAAGAEAGTEAPKELGEEAKAWNAEFVKVDQGTLFELILVRLAFISGGEPVCSHLTGTSSRPLPPRSASGRQLPEHQDAARPDLPDRCQHDQGCASRTLERRIAPRTLLTPAQARRRRRFAQPSTSRTTSPRRVASAASRGLSAVLGTLFSPAHLHLSAPATHCIHRSLTPVQEEEEEVKRENMWAFE